MKVTNRLGFLLLGVWLILTGLAAFGVALPAIVGSVIALVAGILILLGR